MQLRGMKFLRVLKINAIVLWPFVLFAEKEIDAVLLNHERIHLDQIRRDGAVKFYVRYLREYVRGRRRGLSHDAAYRAIGYEVEAYTHQKDLAYHVNRKGHAS